MQNAIIAVHRVANGVGEGPTWDASSGRLYWADITGRAVHRLNPDSGEIESWRELDFPCFAVPCRSGRLLVGLRDGVYWFDSLTGRTTPFVRPEAESRPQNRSNEGKVDPKGRLWLGTMESNLSPDGSERAMARSNGALYCIDARGSTVMVVDGVGVSNTLAWPDHGNTMYFGDSLTNEISRYLLGPSGPGVILKEVFQKDRPAGFCDGSAIDVEGGLWNARFGAGVVVRFAPDGRVDRTITLPCTNPTSCCFGGRDLSTLFVTSARFGLTTEQLAANSLEGALTAINVGVVGAAVPPFAD